MKRFVTAVVAVFFVQAVLEYLLHAVCLSGLYQATASLWRPMDEMRSLSWLMYVSYLVVAVVLTHIYSKGYESAKAGLPQGIRFGLIVGLFLSVPMALNCYAVMPISVDLAAGWFLGGLVEMTVAGAVLGLIWK